MDKINFYRFGKLPSLQVVYSNSTPLASNQYLFELKESASNTNVNKNLALRLCVKNLQLFEA